MKARWIFMRECLAPAPGAARISRSFDMGVLTDKSLGKVNEAVGKGKQHSDDPAQRDEGAGQEVKGKAQQFAGKVKGALGRAYGCWAETVETTAAFAPALA